MNVEEIREYCLSKPGTNESFPFDDTTLVFKVISRMFALLSLAGDNFINLKCDPEKAIQLREEKSYVLPGYHMNKEQWNSVYFDHAGDQELREWIDHSYELIKEKLPKKDREILDGRSG